MKNTIRDKASHFIIIKWPIHQEHITTLNIFTPQNRASKYIKKKNGSPTKRNKQIHNYNQYFNTPCSIINRASTQKISTNK